MVVVEGVGSQGWGTARGETPTGVSLSACRSISSSVRAAVFPSQTQDTLASPFRLEKVEVEG